MNINNFFKEYAEILTQHKLIELSKGKGLQCVEIGEIPKEKSPFLGTQDSWVKVNMPEDVNMSVCVYYGKKGSIFPPHRHPNRDEILLPLNEKGEISYIIEDGRVGSVKYEESLHIPKKMGHYVKFEEDTTLLVLWSPSFNKVTGWTAEILEYVI